MKKLLVFIIALASFAPMNADINFLKIADFKRTGFSRQNNDELVKSLLLWAFDNHEKNVNKTKGSLYTYSIAHTFCDVCTVGRKEYKVSSVFGIVHEDAKDLTEIQKKELVVKAQEAFQDLMKKEVFGQRTIESGITVYCVIQSIEPVE